MGLLSAFVPMFDGGLTESSGIWQIDLERSAESRAEEELERGLRSAYARRASNTEEAHVCRQRVCVASTVRPAAIAATSSVAFTSAA